LNKETAEWETEYKTLEPDDPTTEEYIDVFSSYDGRYIILKSNKSAYIYDINWDL